MSTAGLTTARRDHIHRVMAAHVERGDVPGLVAAVSCRGDEFVDAIGMQAVNGAPIQRDTIFRIASMTKPITAAATMILVDEGRLELDQPVDNLLPELANRTVLNRLDGPLEETVPARRAVTVRDLLTFRFGIGILMAPPGTYPIQREMDDLSLGQGPPNPSSFPDPDEWIRRLGTLPLMYQPGDRWMYNTGSDVLGVLIARASGSTFERFLKERLFEPLEMRDTGFFVPEAKIHRLATSYGTDPTSGELTVYDPATDGQWSRPPAFPSGAGGLVSTIDDYLAFALMLLNGGRHGTTRILSRQSVAMMTRNHLTPDQRQGTEPILEANQGWGFGVSVVTGSNEFGAAVGSYGWSGGLGTIWTTDPVSESVMVLMTQVNWSSPAYPAVTQDFLRVAFDSASE